MKMNHFNISYSYDGFDTNIIWHPIQNQVQSVISSSGTIAFYKDDVFKHYSDTDKEPNVIILNYLLSYIFKNNTEKDISFIKAFLAFLQRLSSYVVLINDINYYAKDYYEALIPSSHDIRYKQWHFKDTQKPYYAYGTERGNSDILFELPNEILENNPNTECHSAQLLIIKG